MEVGSLDQYGYGVVALQSITQTQVVFHLHCDHSLSSRGRQLSVSVVQSTQDEMLLTMSMTIGAILSCRTYAAAGTDMGSTIADVSRALPALETRIVQQACIVSGRP